MQVNAQQGTPQYRDDIIANMQRQLEDRKIPMELENKVRETFRIINLSREEEAFEYLLIRQEFEPSGVAGTLTVNKFPN